MDQIYYDSLNSQPPANEESDIAFEQPQQGAAAYADLSYKHKARGHSLNNPPPDTWAYPHKKGVGTGSNLENFKEEIAARTQRGENCKAIADALNAMGVQTSDRAVSRVRIKWGMRKRAQRKVKTPPTGSDAARMSAKSKVQALRKAELIRMTRQGMTADEIYRNLTARGMELKKGVATVLRLQSAWGLARDERRWLGNFRHQCHKKAKAQQLDAFSEIAKELGVQDMDVWTREKMSEEPARQARHELALKLMGEHAPTNPERRKLQSPRGTNALYVKQTFGEKTTGPSAEPDQDDDGSSSETGDGDGGSVEQASHLSDVDMVMGDEYLPLNDQGDEDIDDCEGEDDDSEGYTRDSTLDLDSAPNTRGKGRSMLRPAATSALVPALEKRPPHRQSDAPPAAQASTQHLTSSILAGPITTFMTPVAARDATTAGVTARSAPPLVLRTEEAESNKSTLSTLGQYDAAAKAYKELLEARNENKPLPGSLTGLPPSAKEVDAAKRKLKEVTQAMMLALD